MLEHAARAMQANALAPVSLTGEHYVAAADRALAGRRVLTDQVDVPEAVFRNRRVTARRQAGRGAGLRRPEAGRLDGQEPAGARKVSDPDGGGLKGQLAQFRLQRR